MKYEGFMKTAFTRECGNGVIWAGAKEGHGSAIDITFTIVERNSTHTIGTHPLNSGREAHENAAAQAGRWARVMADRVAAA